MLAHPAINRLQRPIDALDAAGLALFCVTGASTALTHRLGVAESIILGASPASAEAWCATSSCARSHGPAGRALRHPSLGRSGIVVARTRPGTARSSFTIVGAAVCFLMRMAGLRYGLGLPRADNVAVTSIPRLPENARQALSAEPRACLPDR